jgi:tRNA pseudouridine38-40 synthase
LNKRYFIELSYKGSAYHGWQSQDNATSVQSVIENAISTITREIISITGAGRTDTGVHASYYIAHFDSRNDLSGQEFIYKLNRFLPTDIGIISVKEMHAVAHARFDAVSRTYKYIMNRKKKPFASELSSYVYGDLNVEKMHEAAILLKNYSDFTTFSKLHSDNKTNICRIFDSNVITHGDYVIFTITADRFLRNMVRAITAALIDVGRSKYDKEYLVELINAKDRSRATGSAPAEGLYLTDIVYPESFGLVNPYRNEIFPFVQ